MAHIEVRNVSLVYDTPAGQVPGVAGVSFDIETSEFLCIVGPSGCGKSTLLNVIAGFLAPTAGEIRIGYPHHLSGGMQQRVAIARALAYNPSVLLMDEPFAALDALTRDDMQRLLAEVWRETRKTVVYVTHNVAEAVYLADRVVVMTPHPGMVKTELPIRLPRPRDPLSVEFLDYQKSLLRHLGQDAVAQAGEKR